MQVVKEERGTKGAALASTTTSATDGSYSLTGLPAGTLVLLEVTPQAGTKMVDEATNVQVDVPVGHRERRAEGLPLMRAKYASSVAALYPPRQQASVGSLFDDASRLDAMPVQAFMAPLVRNA